MKALSREQFTEKLNTREPTLRIIGKFAVGNKSTNTFECLSCKVTFRQINKQVLRMTRIACPRCSLDHRRELVRYKAVSKVLPRLLDLCKQRNVKVKESTVTTGSNLSQFKCLVCKRTWTTSPKSFMSMKHGCHTCMNKKSGIQVKKTLWQTKVKPRVRVSCFILKVPEDYNEGFCLKCKICGTTFSNKYRNIKVTTERDGLLCPTCCRRKSFGTGFSKKHEYVLDGKRISLRGYEPKALDWILSNTPITEKEIITETCPNFPTLRYRYRNKLRRYTPDFFIKSKGIIVEVKSLLTSGLGLSKVYFGRTQLSLFGELKAKRKACLTAGYRFKLLVMLPDGRKLKLPKQWYEMSRKELLILINKDAVL